MKTIVITGATSGIGYAAANLLAAQDSRIIAVGRTKENCIAAADKIKSANPNAQIVFFYGDLAQQSEVNNIADEIGEYLDKNCGGALDVLINNAGAIRNWYTTTQEGYETQFAINHLSGFLLTHRLFHYLKKAGGRIIITGSRSHMHGKIRWKDIMFKKHYNTILVYKQAKLCNIMFAKEFNRRFANCGVKAYVVDPGLVNTDIGSKQTSGIVNRFWNLRKKHGDSPEISAQNYVYLSNKLPAPEGLYYRLCCERRYDKSVDNEQETNRLFKLSEKLCGIDRFGEIKK